MQNGRRTGLAAALSALVALAPVCLADEEDPPAPSTPLTRVVEVVHAEDGNPAAGATIEVFGLAERIVRTVGDDGVVRLEKLPRSGITFVAREPGRRCAWHEPGAWDWVRNEEDDDVDGDGVTSFRLVLSAGTRFEGRVAAFADGKPIAGAAVEAWEEVGSTDVRYLDPAPIWTAITNPAGEFVTVEHFAAADRRPGLSARITARAAGYISETEEREPRKRSPARFRLRPAALLSGVVLGSDGMPAPGIAVHAYPADFRQFHRGPRESARWDENEHPRVLHVVTDAQGRYAMPELHPGAKFFVYAEQRAMRAGSDREDGAVARSLVTEGVGVDAPGAEATCDLQLLGLASLLVRVPQDAGGAVQKLRVELTGPPGALPGVDGEAVEGGTLFTEILPGAYTLRIDADGWAPLVRTADVSEGKRTDLTVRMERGATVEGVVVDDAGARVPDVGIYAYPADPATGVLVTEGFEETRTDSDGAFRLSGIRVGPVEVATSRGGYIALDRTRVTAPASGVRITIVREPRLTLHVDAPPGTTLPTKFRATVTPLSGRYAGRTDSRTVKRSALPVVLERVIPGPNLVTVDVPGFAPATLRVEAPPGMAVTAGPFTFEDGVALEGRVVDADGRPVAGARVTPMESAERLVVTGADGRFVVPHLAAGAVELEIETGGFPTALVAGKAGPLAASLDLVLRPGGVVRGTVKDRKAEPAHDRRLCIYTVEATNGYGPHWHGSVTRGAFTLRLPAGKYRFVESRYEFGERPVFFEVTEGGETVLGLVLR